MFCITVWCEGIGREKWPDALADVREEFTQRSWHGVVDVLWSGETLILIAENDYDSNGEALADEFWDTVAAHAPDVPAYSVRVLFVATGSA